MVAGNAGMRLFGMAAFLTALDRFQDSFTASGGWVVGSNVEYAAAQEYGTSSQSGTPHMRPAVDSTRAKMASLAMSANGMDEFLKLTAFHLEGEVKDRAPVDTGLLRSSYSAEPR